MKTENDDNKSGAQTTETVAKSRAQQLRELASDTEIGNRIEFSHQYKTKIKGELYQIYLNYKIDLDTEQLESMMQVIKDAHTPQNIPQDPHPLLHETFEKWQQYIEDLGKQNNLNTSLPPIEFTKEIIYEQFSHFKEEKLSHDQEALREKSPKPNISTSQASSLLTEPQEQTGESIVIPRALFEEYRAFADLFTQKRVHGGIVVSSKALKEIESKCPNIFSEQFTGTRSVSTK